MISFYNCDEHDKQKWCQCSVWWCHCVADLGQFQHVAQFSIRVVARASDWCEPKVVSMCSIVVGSIGHYFIMCCVHTSWHFEEWSWFACVRHQLVRQFHHVCILLCALTIPVATQEFLRFPRVTVVESQTVSVSQVIGWQQFQFLLCSLHYSHIYCLFVCAAVLSGWRSGAPATDGELGVRGGTPACVIIVRSVCVCSIDLVFSHLPVSNCVCASISDDSQPYTFS